MFTANVAFYWLLWQKTVRQAEPEASLLDTPTRTNSSYNLFFIWLPLKYSSPPTAIPFFPSSSEIFYFPVPLNFFLSLRRHCRSLSSFSCSCFSSASSSQLESTLLSHWVGLPHSGETLLILRDNHPHPQHQLFPLSTLSLSPSLRLRIHFWLGILNLFSATSYHVSLPPLLSFDISSVVACPPSSLFKRRFHSFY